MLDDTLGRCQPIVVPSVALVLVLVDSILVPAGGTMSDDGCFGCAGTTTRTRPKNRFEWSQVLCRSTVETYCTSNDVVMRAGGQDCLNIHPRWTRDVTVRHHDKTSTEWRTVAQHIRDPPEESEHPPMDAGICDDSRIS